jgi:hypothetical protein
MGSIPVSPCCAVRRMFLPTRKLAVVAHTAVKVVQPHVLPHIISVLSRAYVYVLSKTYVWIIRGTQCWLTVSNGDPELQRYLAVTSRLHRGHLAVTYGVFGWHSWRFWLTSPGEHVFARGAHILGATGAIHTDGTITTGCMLDKERKGVRAVDLLSTCKHFFSKVNLVNAECQLIFLQSRKQRMPVSFWPNLALINWCLWSCLRPNVIRVCSMGLPDHTFWTLVSRTLFCLSPEYCFGHWITPRPNGTGRILCI